MVDPLLIIFVLLFLVTLIFEVKRKNWLKSGIAGAGVFLAATDIVVAKVGLPPYLLVISLATVLFGVVYLLVRK